MDARWPFRRASERCAGVMADAFSPSGASGLMSSVLFVTISLGAVVLMIAVVRCLSSSAVTRARPGSSSDASTRLPFSAPSRTSAGFDPANDGVLATTAPLETRKWSEM